MLLANPHELSLLKERNPPLAEALLSGDLGKLTCVQACQGGLRGSRCIRASGQDLGNVSGIGSLVILGCYLIFYVSEHVAIAYI